MVGRLLTFQQTYRVEILNIKCNAPTKIRTFKCKCNFSSRLDPTPWFGPHQFLSFKCNATPGYSCSPINKILSLKLAAQHPIAEPACANWQSLRPVR
jgi:hypothetical protein